LVLSPAVHTYLHQSISQHSFPFSHQTGWPDEFVKKNRPKFSPNYFCQKVMHTFYRGKKINQKIRATYVIFKQMPKENPRATLSS
jgi:hypothetical protein